MELSSANRSEIQPDMSDKAFKYVASYTQIEKLGRDVEWLKHQIFNAIAKEEKVEEIEKLIEKYQKAITKMKGYGWSEYEYEKFLPQMIQGVEQLKNED